MRALTQRLVQEQQPRVLQERLRDPRPPRLPIAQRNHRQVQQVRQPQPPRQELEPRLPPLPRPPPLLRLRLQLLQLLLRVLVQRGDRERVRRPRDVREERLAQRLPVPLPHRPIPRREVVEPVPRRCPAVREAYHVHVPMWVRVLEEREEAPGWGRRGRNAVCARQRTEQCGLARGTVCADDGPGFVGMDDERYVVKSWCL